MVIEHKYVYVRPKKTKKVSLEEAIFTASIFSPSSRILAAKGFLEIERKDLAIKSISTTPHNKGYKKYVTTDFTDFHKI